MSGLTDEERELKRLAEDSAANGGAAHGNLLDHIDGSTVLRLLARIEELAALARRGLHAYHDGSDCCPSSYGNRAENPAECEHGPCREWAKALGRTQHHVEE